MPTSKLARMISVLLQELEREVVRLQLRVADLVRFIESEAEPE